MATAAGERALFIPFVVTGARSFVAARRPDEAERWLAAAREFLDRLGFGRRSGAEPCRWPGAPGRRIALGGA